MTGENYLLALAAIGMALGGFTGLINAFRTSGRKWKVQEQMGMRLIFEHSLAAVFLSILPLPIFYTIGQSDIVWIISSSFLACFLLFEFLYHGVQVTRLTMAGRPPRRLLPLLFHFFPFTLAALVLQVVNVARWHEVWPFFWGLFWLLQPPAVQFYHFISFAETESETTDGALP